MTKISMKVLVVVCLV
jgi:hypothetical protein